MKNKRWLIDVNEFRKIFWSKLKDLKFIGPVDVEHIILNTPKVDVAEVVHGRWERQWLTQWFINGHDRYQDREVERAVCSCCGFVPNFDYEWISIYNYCPNCGADMRGIEDGK